MNTTFHPIVLLITAFFVANMLYSGLQTQVSRRFIGGFELAEQGVHMVLHQREQQFLLGADVIVERPRLDPDLGRELAQAHGRITVFEDETETGFADRLHRLRAV